jgi:hypothetical protein
MMSKCSRRCTGRIRVCALKIPVYFTQFRGKDIV